MNEGIFMPFHFYLFILHMHDPRYYIKDHPKNVNFKLTINHSEFLLSEFLRNQREKDYYSKNLSILIILSYMKAVLRS